MAKQTSNGHIDTSKILVTYLYALLTAIVIFSMCAMWHFANLTYLGVLITDVAAQILLYAIYCVKAYNGKKQEELVKLEKQKLNVTKPNG